MNTSAGEEQVTVNCIKMLQSANSGINSGKKALRFLKT